MENERQPSASTYRGKRWCFTLNNYTAEEEKAIASIEESAAPVLIVGRERGESGTPHLQGYCEFSSRKRLAEVKRVCGAFQRAHFEAARGSPADNYAYCSKDGNILVVRGNFRKSKHESNSVSLLYEKLNEGVSDESLWTDEDTFGLMLRHHRAIAQYRLCKASNAGREVKVIAYIGEPGTGKTRAVFEAEPKVYWATGERWFDGYNGQEAVLFDDFRGDKSGISFQFFLRILDRYPIIVPIKGGFVDFVPRRIYITSNLPWWEWYPDDKLGCLDDDRNPLKRRLHEIKNF